MKKLILILSICIGMKNIHLIFILICFVSCNNNSPNNYKEYDLPAGCQELNIEMEKAILIQNEKDLNALFSAYQNIEPINFNKSALLIIKGESTSGILSMTKDIKIDNKRIYINIAIVHGYTTVMEKWIVGYVIPNNIEIEDISFNIDYREYSADWL